MAKFAGNMQTDQKLVQDVATGMMVEPGSIADAAHAMAKNASPLFWFGLQQRFAQEQMRTFTSMMAPKATTAENAQSGAPTKPDPRFAAPEWD